MKQEKDIYTLTFLQWCDTSPDSFPVKLKRAIGGYEKKHGEKPNYIRISDLIKDEVKIEGITIERTETLWVNSFQLGRMEVENAGKTREDNSDLHPGRDDGNL